MHISRVLRANVSSVLVQEGDSFFSNVSSTALFLVLVLIFVSLVLIINVMSYVLFIPFICLHSVLASA